MLYTVIFSSIYIKILLAKCCLSVWYCIFITYIYIDIY